MSISIMVFRSHSIRSRRSMGHGDMTLLHGPGPPQKLGSWNTQRYMRYSLLLLIHDLVCICFPFLWISTQYINCPGQSEHLTNTWLWQSPRDPAAPPAPVQGAPGQTQLSVAGALIWHAALALAPPKTARAAAWETEQTKVAFNWKRSFYLCLSFHTQS